MDMKKVGPPGLEQDVVDRLLDLLSTDDQFRALFVADANAWRM
jgi:putative modified peptide